jgi:hypothetical protein
MRCCGQRFCSSLLGICPHRNICFSVGKLQQYTQCKVVLVCVSSRVQLRNFEKYIGGKYDLSDSLSAAHPLLSPVPSSHYLRHDSSLPCTTKCRICWVSINHRALSWATIVGKSIRLRQTQRRRPSMGQVECLRNGHHGTRTTASESSWYDRLMFNGPQKFHPVEHSNNNRHRHTLGTIVAHAPCPNL